MIEMNLSRLLRSLDLPPGSTRRNTPSGNTSRQDNTRNDMPNDIRDVNAQSTNVDPSIRFDPNISNIPCDKITSIIQNWNLKFDGSSTGLNVDEFLYRVRSLTQDNFRGDFNVICRNLNILLIGKAREWFWRYHKRVTTVQWDDFCDAIRSQYKEFKSPFDIKEEIRGRKQKVGETFDAFLDSITTMMDRLPEPVPEYELVEILCRNLRPDIRQELLFVQINSLSHLRRLVQKRENFLNDEYVRKSLTSRPANVQHMPRRNISELEALDDEPNHDDEGKDRFVEAFHKVGNMTCWNCDGVGHHWHDCVETRTIFCYGCGLKDTYKPNCSKCGIRKSIVSKNFNLPGSNKDLP